MNRKPFILSLRDVLKRHYLLFLFIAMIPVMMARVNINPRAVIWSDTEGYYQYLPGLFIIKDFHKLPAGSIWPYFNNKGEYVDKYTYGIALFEFPFFAAAYYLSPLFGADQADYFNPVYCKAIALCGLFFAFLGLVFLKKALVRIVSPAITFWIILSVFFGTNLYHYATKEMGMAHGFSFCLFALFIYVIPLFLKRPDWKNNILLGALLGWITLIRPTNFVIVLLLLMYDVYSMRDLEQRVRFLFQHIRTCWLIIPSAFIFFIPQMMYWKEMTGHWYYYAYKDERFQYWNEPRIPAVLFDTQNGLFLYSPLVLLMITGMILGIFRRNFQAPVMLILFCVITYLFASWWTWWFGGAFGHRCYIEFYALFAFPLAGLYDYIQSRWNKPARWIFFTFVILLCAFSVRLSYLYTSIGGPWDGQDWRWNWEQYQWVLSYLFNFKV